MSKPVDLVRRLIQEVEDRSLAAERRRVSLWTVDPTPANGWCAPSEVIYGMGDPIAPFKMAPVDKSWLEVERTG